MSILSSSQVCGNQVSLLTNNPRHIGSAAAAAIPAPQGSPTPTGSAPEQSFADVLLKALDSVNDDQLRTTELSQQLITSPDSVDVHDVTIALTQANLSLSMAKAVVDRALRAYQDIITPR